MQEISQDSQGGITISPCLTRKQRKLFERVPELIHAESPYYVPPFPGTVSVFLGDKSNFRRHGEVHPFIAYQQGKPVGRIAAVVNRTHNEYYKDKTGFFGFFDFIDDEQVARALLDTAKEVLKKKGFETIRGPYNPSINDECGVLTAGFESLPYVMTTYNPSYYVRLYEALGLQSQIELYAFQMSAETIPPERVRRIAERVRRSTRVQLRNVNIKRLEEELKVVHRLFNCTLDRNWGFVPITYEDLLDSAKDLKPIVDPNMLIFAEKEGKPVGFALIIPDINEFLWKVRKLPLFLRILKFVWLLKTTRPKQARFTVLGVHPEYRNSGLAALFYYEALMRAKGKYVGGELSWVEETNRELIKSIHVMGAQKSKTYRIYETPL